MKVTVTEYEGCFGIELHAEDIKEAATLTRMGVNATREVRTFASWVSMDGEFSASVVFGKNKKANSDIVRRR